MKERWRTGTPPRAVESARADGNTGKITIDPTIDTQTGSETISTRSSNLDAEDSFDVVLQLDLLGT